MKRRPAQTLLLAVAVVAGLGIGSMVTQQWKAADRGAGGRWPDVHLVHAAPRDLALQGFRLSGREPVTWRDICLRMKQDGQGGVLFLRCVITPDEADRLLDWPLGSRCAVDPHPPGDWPRGPDGGICPVPDWWRPEVGRARLFERVADGVQGRGDGIFARYDPGNQVLHLWQWHRSGWRPGRSDAVGGPVIDQVVLRLGRGDLPSEPLTDGWWQVPPTAWSVMGLPPCGATEIVAAIRPAPRHHRYLLAIRGIDEPDAWRLAADQPLHVLPDDGAAPVERWAFAMPKTGLPAWFAPGAGPRRCHVLVRVGSGMVEAGRWLAYDHAVRTLFAWDWADAEPHGVDADLMR